KQREELFLHDSGQLTAAGDFVGRSPRQKLLPDEGEFVAVQVLKGKFVADGERFAIHEKYVVAAFVFDGEIVAKAEQLLLHQVAHDAVLREMRRDSNAFSDGL